MPFSFGAPGFLFKVDNLSYPEALFIIGLVVAGTSVLALLVRFSPEMEREAQAEMDLLLAEKETIMVAEPAYEVEEVR